MGFLCKQEKWSERKFIEIATKVQTNPNNFFEASTLLPNMFNTDQTSIWTSILPWIGYFSFRIRSFG